MAAATGPFVALFGEHRADQADQGALASVPDRTRRVLFVCTANSARSQLAAAAWRRVSPLPVISAGTHPAEQVHPTAVDTAGRHGLDLTTATTNGLGDVHAADNMTLVVAVCDNAHEELARTGLPG